MISIKEEFNFGAYPSEEVLRRACEDPAAFPTYVDQMVKPVQDKIIEEMARHKAKVADEDTIVGLVYKPLRPSDHIMTNRTSFEINRRYMHWDYAEVEYPCGPAITSDFDTASLALRLTQRPEYQAVAPFMIKLDIDPPPRSSPCGVKGREGHEVIFKDIRREYSCY